MTPHIVPRTTYAIVFAALVLLLALTVGVARHDLAGFDFAAAMAIAVAKTLLIVLYFMHLRYGSRLTQIFAAAGVFWLAILLTLTMADYLTRSEGAPPFGGGAPPARSSDGR